MRLFIAIEIPEGIKKEMAEIQRRLRGAGVEAGWTRAEGIHLTLKFLGEVPEAMISEINGALNSAVGGAEAFTLDVAGVGTFPNPRNARVVWTGLSGETDRLANLQNAVEGAMNGVGFKREERPFTAHLTLGRIKHIVSRDRWLAALDEVRDIRLPSFTAGAVSLMKSDLKRSGAVYTEIGKVELQK